MKLKKREKEKVLAARVSPDLHRRVRRKALEEEVSVTRLLKQAVVEYLKRPATATK